MAFFGDLFGGGGPSEEEQAKKVDTAMKEYTVLLEFAKMQEYDITDMYVLPEFENCFAWHGVLFLHQGLY